MRILIVSPYHGGSHKAWAEGYQQFSSHKVALLTLPARFWKWRMHGGAVTLARRFVADLQAAITVSPDILLVTDMLDLTTFLALTRRWVSHIPTVLYMHENQLTYPLPANPQIGPMRRQRGERDLHYAFINYASMLAADRVLFNSQYHWQNLLQNLPNFLKHFPEYNELKTLESLREKSSVVPVGLNLDELLAVRPQQRLPLKPDDAPPLILWNQRWEYDKNPAAFFRALYQMKAENLPFRVALCGEQYSRSPQAFLEAQERLADHIIHTGYVPRETYLQLLWAADIVISTALHEFFGISVLEAILCQTFPILPHRLSYPELLPEVFHPFSLYEEEPALVDRLRWALQHRQDARDHAASLASAMRHFDWSTVAQQYDRLFESLVDEYGS